MYVLARDRPIDIRPVICPCALRLIHIQNPISSRMGRIHTRAWPRMLELGEWNLTLTFLERSSSRSLSGRMAGPVVVKLLPSVS